MPLLNLDIVDTLNPSGMGMPTRDLLVRLGFETVVAEYADEQPGYRYDFGNLELLASQVMSLGLQREILFTGSVLTRREIGMVEFSLPLQVENFELGVALMAYYLGSSFTPAIATSWLDMGRQWKDRLPWRRDALLYAQRPQCHVQAGWFRVAIKELLEQGSQAAETEGFKVSLKEGVLRFDFPNHVLVMPASGEDWPNEYWALSIDLAKLSKRTSAAGIRLGVWNNELEIGPNRLSLKASPSPVGAISAAD